MEQMSYLSRLLAGRPKPPPKPKPPEVLEINNYFAVGYGFARMTFFFDDRSTDDTRRAYELALEAKLAYTEADLTSPTIFVWRKPPATNVGRWAFCRVIGTWLPEDLIDDA